MNKSNLIIIDTDPGHDDALAIMLLAKSNKFDISALTTVSGNVDIQKTTNNARFILDLIKQDIPIYSGEAKPIKRDPVFANVHGTSGLAGANVIKTEKLNRMAVEKIIEIVKANPKKVTILTLGPLTNIAKAFQNEPNLPRLIKRIVIMGGAINVPGNKSAVAEFNMLIDPEAAKIVFESGVKKILIPLDVCNSVPLFLSDFKKIDGFLKKPIMSMMKHFIKGILEFENFKGALVYDALAAYYLLNPRAFKIQKMDMKVESLGEFTSGMTIADKRNWGNKKPNVFVAKSLNREVFVKDFIEILSERPN